MLVRIGSLLTVTFVVLIAMSWVGEAGRPRQTQISPIAVDIALSASATGSDPIAVTAHSSRQDDDVADTVDLYGNEVNAAVATYRLDRTGALYELHSPQTEVPQLPPPKS